MNLNRLKMAGFTLLPVVLSMSLIAAIAFLLNRDNGINTNMMNAQTNTDRARYAAEAGLQAVNAQIQSLGCAGGFPVASSPVTNNNFSGASYSAFASSASGNTTSLSATGTFNGTSVTLTRNNIYVYQSPVTYTLQPGSAAGIDTYIDSADEKNYGNTSALSIKKSQQSLLFKFDFSAFPTGSVPVSATFSIYGSGGLANGLELFRMTSDWTEGTGNNPLDGVTWNTSNGSAGWAAGGNFFPVKFGASGILGSNWASFDVTAMTNAWLSGQYPNEGMLVKSTLDLGSYKYTSSDDSNATRRPNIAITYLTPCGATGPKDTPHGTVTLNPIADSFNDTNTSQLNHGAATTLKLYNNATLENRILSKFDTSSIPAGSTITSATLRMFVSGVASASTNTKSIWANAVDESWVEGAGNGTSKTCPTATAGTSWKYRTDCASWANNLHPPYTAQSWTSVAPIPTARTRHMVATVNNKIYVIGGHHPAGGYFKTVEEYDPATNTWASKTNMPTARADASIAVVSGKIYVIGGTSNGITTLKTNEMYDPVANTWTSKANMTTARMYLAASVVNNKIYAIGGGQNTLLALKTNEMYDPVANTWTNKANMTTARMYLSAQTVNGKIYAIGGWGGLSSLDKNEVYDPSANSWANKTALSVGADSMASAVLGNKIYLIAGLYGSTTSNAVQVYDTINNNYTAQLNYPLAANVPAAVAVNSTIYSMGGDNYGSTIYQNNYKFVTGAPVPVATASNESSSASPIEANFTNGWIKFELAPLVQEWVDGVRPNNGLVIYTEVPDQLSINSRENTTKNSGNDTKPQLIVTY